MSVWVASGICCVGLTYLLSILMAIGSGGPGLAGIRMSPFWILLELRMMEVVVTTGAVRRAKLQSNCHHQQLFGGRLPFLSPNQHVGALKEV